MPVRMKDIARDLGVSVVTVSKVLRHHSDIGEETRAKVLQRMKELNYRPNLAARALVTGRTFTVGLVVPDLVHPFFSEVAKGMARALRQKGYSLLIASSEEDPALEQKEIDNLLARRVDALVVASAQLTAGGFRHIEEQKTPYVLIDRQFAGQDANFVGVDDQTVGDLATEHLFAAGCRRIAHIRGPETSTALGRLEGYRKALARHDLMPGEGYIVTGHKADDAGVESGDDAMRLLLSLQPRPDGVFCYNDPVAMGAMQAILASGLRIPQDVAVIGSGNVHYAGLLRVPLSSVDQSSRKIGENAAELAMILVESKLAGPPKRVLLQPTVVPRQSTAR